MTQPSEFLERRQKLTSHFRELKVDALLVTALPNVRYLTGFTGSNGALLLSTDSALFLTDPRYEIQAAQEVDCDVKIARIPLLKEVAVAAKRADLRKLGFEQTRISFSEYSVLKDELRKAKLKPVGDRIETMRRVKSDVEIATIRTSVELNSAALDESLRQFKPEMTEVDLAAEIDYRMRRLGADGVAFDTIVASGARTALPHARPTEGLLQTNQLLLIDMGARVAGYCSDMTRTYALGRLSAKLRSMYRAVLESQLAAIQAVQPGATAASVDRAAREVLRGRGLDRAFVHSTGHGLGLEIHEGPRIGRKEKTKLEPGMVITIEPGVYMEGTGGVRIEDTVVVTEQGCRVLTPTNKELRLL